MTQAAQWVDDRDGAEDRRGGRGDQVYLDLTAVRFIDSSGIHALMRCRARAIEAGCRLAVTNAQPIIYRVLEITGVLEALGVTRCSV